ncbi:hypothetical protein [Halomonas elongata]|uniref:Uncharacterized protein n=2 Tax=Halomonas elongata TaxID=2746 RepID=A0A1B8P691_HALEL|nr:hypothetical protein [Halomonas elongata]MBW5801069.1 hypothetical protein [Halomonas elongata]OBX37752.1 hypothetical protein A8U91_02130 [Halomonas elongata]RAW07513.1 hypothetical protein DKQ62_08295 [Halomonas elongata]WBF18689.1 hypothetical protein LM502_03010 [Halomonas elongata]WPU47544.1 hypothetical protein SR933_01235 [Halomonas elongata DSM 2581]
MIGLETLRHRTRGSRLLALLLVLVVLSPSLATPAMAACAADCIMAQATPSDVDDEPGCVVCSPVPTHAALPDTRAEPLASGPAPAMIDHIPQPPRRPPRA